jgi:hypothetical protein
MWQPRGGWKDITTLINCYQQPDEETLRSVVEYRRRLRRLADTRLEREVTKVTHTVTHTVPQNGESAAPDNPLWRFRMPRLASNQDSPDPESVPRGQRFRLSYPETDTYRASVPASLPQNRDDASNGQDSPDSLNRVGVKLRKTAKNRSGENRVRS